MISWCLIPGISNWTFSNRTQLNTNCLIGFDNQTHNKTCSIEQLPNGWRSCSIECAITELLFVWFLCVNINTDKNEVLKKKRAKYFPIIKFKCLFLGNFVWCFVLLYLSGVNVATCGVANATSFYSLGTKFSCLVTSLAPKMGDFLLWENVHYLNDNLLFFTN